MMSLDQALHFYDGQRYDQAAREARSRLSAAPRDAFAHAILALCLHMQREDAESLQHAWEAVRLEPELGFAYYALARALTSRLRWTRWPWLGRSVRDKAGLGQVQAALRKALELNPGNPDFFALKAEVEASLGHWREGMAAANQGLSLDPLHAVCAQQRARALLHLGHADTALAEWHRAQGLDPDQVLTPCYRGWTAMEEGRPDEALPIFLDGLRVEPSSEWLQSGLVAALQARRSIWHGLVAWDLRIALWRARPRWKRQVLFALGLIYAGSFAALSLALGRGSGPLLLRVGARAGLAAVVTGVAVACVLGLTWVTEAALRRWLRRSCQECVSAEDSVDAPEADQRVGQP